MIAYSKIQRKIFDVLDCGGHTLWEDCCFETKNTNSLNCWFGGISIVHPKMLNGIGYVYVLCIYTNPFIDYVSVL